MPNKPKLTTVYNERALLAFTERKFHEAGVPDATARAKLVCERFRYRARRGWPSARNFDEAVADVRRIVNGVLSC